MRGELAASDESLVQAAAAAGLCAPALAAPDPRLAPLDRAPLLPCDQWAADLVEDLLPEVGLVAPGRVLGPFADERPSARSRLVAAGVLAFCPHRAPQVRPVDRWYRDRRASPVDERATLRAVDRAPPMLWSVVDGAAPVPELPLPVRLRPPGPVQLLPWRCGEPTTPLRPGSWVARLLPGPGGWLAAMALRLPAPVHGPRLLRRMELELWRQRAWQPGLGWPSFLRLRGEVLYRCCHERAWSAREEER